MRRFRVFLLTAVFLAFQLIPAGLAKTYTAHAMDDGLAVTPPMGWNSWNKFGGNIDENKIMAMADAMVTNGMKEAGYEYINIDDNWMATTRDANGYYQADPTRFPHGIKYVADYVHSKGLKLGIYSSNGTKTCMGLPGGQGYEDKDAEKYAEWGVDYLKYDFCSNVRSIPSAYAPDIDKIVITNGTNNSTYEAESSINTITGGARISGTKVGYIGNNNGDLTFNKVTVPASGEYGLTVYYYNGEASRGLFISVNGGEGTKYDLPSSGGWSTLGTYTNIKVNLNQGENTIKLYNPTDNTILNRQISAQQYGTMSAALQKWGDKYGHKIVFSLCEWGSWQPWLWGSSIAHLWRTTGDISDNWGSMTGILDQNAVLAQYAGPGHWNDPDMLEVGNGGMSDTEYRAHFSLWSIMAAPLIAGNDITNMSQATKSILLNKEVIAVDQDSIGKQGIKIKDDGDHEVFVKPLANGDSAVVLFNRGLQSSQMSITASEIGLPTAEAYLVRDLWQHIDKGSLGTISAEVPSHGAVMLRVSPSTIDKVPASLGISFSSNPLAEAGKTMKVTTTFTNDGIKTVTNASASLQVPEGWTANASSAVDFVTIELGKSVSVDWNITSPVQAPVGVTNISAQVSFVDGTNTIKLQSSTQVNIVPNAPKNTTYLSDINWYYATNGWGPIERDMSVGENGSNDGKPITLNGIKYSKGLGTHAPAEADYYIGGNYAAFTSEVGLDDEIGTNGTVNFEVWGDGTKLWSSGIMSGSSATKTANVDIRGVKILKLVITDGGDNKDYDHADWANAMIRAALKEISVAADKTSIRPGDNSNLSVAGKVISGETADLSQANKVFTSSDENIAVVDENGKVTGVNNGKTTIKTAVTLDGITCDGSIEIVVDGTAPTIDIIGINNGDNIKLNQNITVTWKAADNLSGVKTASGDIISGSKLDTSKIGPHTITFTVMDNAGNTTKKTITYNVQYDFSDILKPINSDGTNVFKLGSTVPVKFQLKDAQGVYVGSAAAKLYIAKIVDGKAGVETLADSTSAASTGNAFRYDDTSNQYIFNLNTKDLTAGTYQIRIDLGDGTTNIISIGLR